MILSTTGDPRGRAHNLGHLPPRAQVADSLAVAINNNRKLGVQNALGWLHSRRHRITHRRAAAINTAAAAPVAAYSSQVIVYSGQASAAEAGQTLWTVWDKAYVVGAGAVFLYGEVFHPRIFGDEVLPFLPLMAVSVYGAVGVVACWGLSVVAVLSAA